MIHTLDDIRKIHQFRVFDKAAMSSAWDDLVKIKDRRKVFSSEEIDEIVIYYNICRQFGPIGDTIELEDFIEIQSCNNWRLFFHIPSGQYHYSYKWQPTAGSSGVYGAFLDKISDALKRRGHGHELFSKILNEVFP